jgi:hypothetical protein
MNVHSQSTGRSLSIYLSPEITFDLRIDLHTIFKFAIRVSAQNITECILVVSTDETEMVFREREQKFKVEFDSSTTEQTIAISLTPINRTVTPAWIMIEAKADTIIQASGFFVTVT